MSLLIKISDITVHRISHIEAAWKYARRFPFTWKDKVPIQQAVFKAWPLAEICNIHLQEGWSSLDTPLGSIKVSPNGDALIDSTTWDKMKELFFESDVVDSGMFYSNTKTIKKIIIMRKSKEVSN